MKQGKMPIMSNTKKSFVVGDRYDAFIAKQVAEGRFNNSSEVVRAGLRILEDHENRLAAMRAHVQASLNDPRPRMLVDEGFERLEAKYTALAQGTVTEE